MIFKVWARELVDSNGVGYWEYTFGGKALRWKDDASAPFDKRVPGGYWTRSIHGQEVAWTGGLDLNAQHGKWITGFQGVESEWIDKGHSTGIWRREIHGYRVRWKIAVGADASDLNDPYGYWGANINGHRVIWVDEVDSTELGCWIRRIRDQTVRWTGSAANLDDPTQFWRLNIGTDTLIVWSDDDDGDGSFQQWIDEDAWSDQGQPGGWQAIVL